MKRKFFAVILAIAMTVSGIPSDAWAGEADIGTEVSHEYDGVLIKDDRAGILESSYLSSVNSSMCGENLEWAYDSQTRTLTISGYGDMYNYNTESYYSGTIETDVPWEDVLQDILIVEFRGKITSIGNCAFSDCANLSKIELPDSINRIGEGAFARCVSLTAMQIPESVTELGNKAFVGCSSLVEVSLSQGIKRIGESTFSACSKLREILLPSQLEEIGLTAFNSCTQLKSVVLPETIREIGYAAFYGCSSITDIYIPYSVEKISNMAFYSTGITSVTVDSPMAEYGPSNDVFGKDMSKIDFHIRKDSSIQGYLDYYKVPYELIAEGNKRLSVTSFGYEGSYDREKHGITVTVNNFIENGYQIYYSPYEMLFGQFGAAYTMMDTYEEELPGEKTIYYYVCAKGYPIEKGSAVIKIGKLSSSLFYEDKEVTKALDDGSFKNPLSGTTDGTISYTSDNENVAVVNSSTGEVTINGVGSCDITANASAGAVYEASSASYTLIVEELKSLKILEQPKDIQGVLGSKACLALKASGEGLRYQWRYSSDGKVSDTGYFIAGNTESTELVFSKSTSKSTYWCHITDKFGNEVDSETCRLVCNIEEGYLANGVCGDSISWHLDKNGMLTIEGTGTLDIAYKSWNDFEDDICAVIIREGITKVGDGVFYDMSDVEYVFLPKTLEEIGEEAFANISPKFLMLPDNLKVIGNGSFRNIWLSDDESIVLPRTLEKIGAGAFARCQIESISVPPSVKEIGDSAFMYIGTVECEEGSYAHQYCQENGISFKLVDYAGRDKTLYEGVCGDNVSWEFEPYTGILYLHGSGATLDYPVEYPSFYPLRAGITLIQVDSGISTIGAYLFYGLPILQSVTLPDTITAIGSGGLRKCGQLSEINMLGHAPNLGENVFKDVSQNLCINIPANGVGYSRGDWKYLSIEERDWSTDKEAPQPVNQPEYTITFHANGGTGLNQDSRTIKKGGAIGELPMVTRTGYTLKGWYTAQTGGMAVTKDTIVSADIILYAQWEAVQKPSIEKAAITLSQTSYFYDGNEKNPEVVSVKLGNTTLKFGTDYTVEYQNNKNIGTATVVITGKGGYIGTATKTFTIRAKTGITITSGAYKYKITGSEEAAFAGLKSSTTKKVTIPKTVNIGGKTFKVTSINAKALQNTKVTSVTIGANVKIIGLSAFAGCSKLSKVTIGKSVTKISSSAFKNCTALKSVTIPSKVTAIGTRAFSGCRKLEKITVKSTKLKTVGKNALKGIKSTAEIKVPPKKLMAYQKLLKSKGQGKNVKITK